MILREPASQAANSLLRVTRIDPQADPRWRDFVLAHPKASIYHHPAWIKALEAEYGQPAEHLACEREGGQLVAVLPLLRTRGMPLRLGGSLARRRLASLPRTPLAGPVSDDPRATSMLLREAVRLAAQTGALLQIKSGDGELDSSADGLVAVPWRCTYGLKLPDNYDGLFRIPDTKERSRIKWAIAKGTKTGLTVRPAETARDIREWYTVYLKTMRRSIIAARPLRLFTALWESLKPAGMMDLLLAELSEGRRRKVIAGAVFFYCKDTASYSFSGLDRSYSSLRATEAILWHAINDACAKGFRRFDFGEVPDGNYALARFKIKWGAEPERLYRYYSPMSGESRADAHPGSGAFPSAVWRWLPLKFTEWVGDRVYSYL